MSGNMDAEASVDICTLIGGKAIDGPKSVGKEGRAQERMIDVAGTALTAAAAAAAQLRSSCTSIDTDMQLFAWQQSARTGIGGASRR